MNPTNVSMNTMQWNHVAFTGDGSTLKYYLNGDHYQSCSMSGGDGLNITNDSTPQMTIGHYRDGSGSYLGHWDGKISQVLLYDRTLSDSEIENLYDEDGENCGNANSQGCGDSTPDQTGKVLEYIAAYQGNNNNGCATQENPNGVCDYSALYNLSLIHI